MSTFILRDIAGREYPVGASASIGREQTCQVVVEDPSVSRVHATIWERQGVLYVRDENSRNGTFVGGAQIAPVQPTPLRAGDELRVGNVTFFVMLAPVPAGTVPTHPMFAPPTVAMPPMAIAQPPMSPPPTRVVTPIATAQPPKSNTALILGCVALVFFGIVGFCAFSLGGLAILGSGYSTPIPITVQAIATTAPIVQQLPTVTTVSVFTPLPPTVTPTIAPATVAPPPTVTPTIAPATVAPPPTAPTATLNACPPNPYYVRLVNELNTSVTINLSGPRTYRIVLPVGGKRDTCFVAGTYSSLLSASGYKDTAETKTFAATTGNPWCWWFYPGAASATPCTAPTDLRLYSPPDTAGAMLSPDAINIFFTIQNGSPTGYVIDKEGAKYTPPGYLTISGFHVNVGDRIVIQTDQSRFSMLFDCGTTPQIYNPCDFIAGMPSNLPAEIRKMARGTAFLNISRADNWAGTRPGFPLLRYPAEPVLRIMLGD